MNTKKMTFSGIAAAGMIASSATASAIAMLAYGASGHLDYKAAGDAIGQAINTVKDIGAKLTTRREELESEHAGADSTPFKVEHFDRLGDHLVKTGVLVGLSSYKAALGYYRIGGELAALAAMEQTAKALFHSLEELKASVATCSAKSESVGFDQIVADNLAGNPLISSSKVMTTQMTFIGQLTSAAMITAELGYMVKDKSLLKPDTDLDGNAGHDTGQANPAVLTA